MVLNGCQRAQTGTKRAPTSATMSQGLSQKPARGKIWTAVFRTVSILFENGCPKGRFWDSKMLKDRCNKSMPKKWRRWCQHGFKMMKIVSRTDATSMHILEMWFCPKHVFSNDSQWFLKIEGSTNRPTNHHNSMSNRCSETWYRNAVQLLKQLIKHGSNKVQKRSTNRCKNNC